METNKTTRELALEWWRKIPDFATQNVLKTGKNGLAFVYYPKRTFQSLTGREIEEIWRKEIGNKLEQDIESACWESASPISNQKQLAELENLGNGVVTFKSNQKQFKQFDESLFKAYINKFSYEDKLNALKVLFSSLKSEDKFHVLEIGIDKI